MIYLYNLLRILEEYFLDNVYLTLKNDEYDTNDKDKIISGKGSKVFIELIETYKYDDEFNSYTLEINNKYIKSINNSSSFKESIKELNENYEKKILNNLKAEVRRNFKKDYKKNFMDDTNDYKIRLIEDINKKIRIEIINETKKEIKDELNRLFII